MISLAKSIAVVAIVASLGACASNGGPKQNAGALLGAAGGAVAGAQFGKGNGKLAAVAAGTLIGAVIGSEAGASMDRADRLHQDRYGW